MFAVLNSVDDTTKYEKWTVLEEIMKESFTQLNRRLLGPEELEGSVEAQNCSRWFRVESTGALLTFESARQHLNHYCATLPRRTGRPESSPVYLFEPAGEGLLRCKVILPPSLSPDLQVIHALEERTTERTAKEDAAFEACKKLYEAGLLNEHLLPPMAEKDQGEISKTQINSFTEVITAFNVWEYCRTAIKTRKQMYAHRIRISGSESHLPDLMLLLPISLPCCHDSALFQSSENTLVATVTPVSGVEDLDHALAEKTTLFLFNSTLARRLQFLRVEEDQLPYYLLPDIPLSGLEVWLNTAEVETPLEDTKLQPNKTYAIKKKARPTPYLYVTARGIPGLMAGQATIHATRVSKKLDFSTIAQAGNSSIRELEVGECTVSNLPAGYFQVIVFVPTIMHQVQLALRTQAACRDILEMIDFENMMSLTSALTAPSASRKYNFQRLEYLGDALLKFYSTVALFSQNPGLPESQLTVLRDQVVKNERLRQRVVELGLDVYLSTEPFNPRLWTLKSSSVDTGARKLSNKTLADVMEALIGAAYMDTCILSSKESKMQRALTLFLPELQWTLPEEGISNMILVNSNTFDDSQGLSQVEEMIGHRFRNRFLLREALTQSAVVLRGQSWQSYERLEFLGDAVIDMIVKEALFRSKHEFSEGQMYTRHITLVNKDILAYLAATCSHRIEVKDVSFNLQKREVEFETKWERRCLHDYVVRVAVDDGGDVLKRFMKNYDQVKEVIAEALEQGPEYPWSAIYQLDSPKWCSDIFESLIGAVFVDSGACMESCERVLKQLGLMRLIERAAEGEKIEFRRPLTILREKLPALKVDSKKFRHSSLLKDDSNRWGCRLRLGDRVLAIAKGCSCQAEAENRAAELALARVMNDGLENVEEDSKTSTRKRNEEMDQKAGQE
jgi:dsRNA-specific ribonuclease